MSDESHQSYFDAIPAEILLKLLSYITTKELIKCRGVSLRWKSIIDEMTRHEYFWRTVCKLDYPNVSSAAWYKSRPSMKWFHIYRSLSLWAKLDEAKEEQDEFCSAPSTRDEIISYTVLRHGVIGVLKASVIKYYDIETLKPFTRTPIPGQYFAYAENEAIIVVVNAQSQLYIVQKNSYDSTNTTSMICQNNRTFLLHNNSVYFVDLDEDIFVATCNDRQLSRKFLCHSNETIMTMGVRDDVLYVLTFERTIYKVKNNALVVVSILGPTSNLLHEFYLYNLLETLQWRVYVTWYCFFHRGLPPNHLQDVITTCVYGNVIFVGSNWGVLLIYYKPFSNGKLDLFNAKPVKQYNFMEHCDFPVPLQCPIRKIDVVEVENGHTVIVAMREKIAILNFRHDFSINCNNSMRLATLTDYVNFVENPN